MTDVYHRTALARQMAEQLLKPKVLDRPLRSGLFLSGLRRTGKTTFLRQDLIPVLEQGDWGPGAHARSAVVIYVDLWSNEANREVSDPGGFKSPRSGMSAGQRRSDPGLASVRAAV